MCVCSTSHTTKAVIGLNSTMKEGTDNLNAVFPPESCLRLPEDLMQFTQFTPHLSDSYSW